MRLTKTKILITGVAGFIGSNLANNLLSTNSKFLNIIICNIIFLIKEIDYILK
jgi:nucleoside-diphosphate-sugar epimerase